MNLKTRPLSLSNYQDNNSLSLPPPPSLSLSFTSGLHTSRNVQSDAMRERHPFLCGCVSAVWLNYYESSPSCYCCCCWFYLRRRRVSAFNEEIGGFFFFSLSLQLPWGCLSWSDRASERTDRDCPQIRIPLHPFADPPHSMKCTPQCGIDIEQSTRPAETASQSKFINGRI